LFSLLPQNEFKPIEDFYKNNSNVTRALPNSEDIAEALFQHFSDDALKARNERSTKAVLETEVRLLRQCFPVVDELTCIYYKDQLAQHHLTGSTHRMLTFFFWLSSPWTFLSLLPTAEEFNGGIFQVRLRRQSMISFFFFQSLTIPFCRCQKLRELEDDIQFLTICRKKLQLLTSFALFLVSPFYLEHHVYQDFAKLFGQRLLEEKTFRLPRCKDNAFIRVAPVSSVRMRRLFIFIIIFFSFQRTLPQSLIERYEQLLKERAVDTQIVEKLKTLWEVCRREDEERSLQAYFGNWSNCYYQITSGVSEELVAINFDLLKRLVISLHLYRQAHGEAKFDVLSCYLISELILVWFWSFGMPPKSLAPHFKVFFRAVCQKYDHRTNDDLDLMSVRDGTLSMLGKLEASRDQLLLAIPSFISATMQLKRSSLLFLGEDRQDEIWTREVSVAFMQLVW
jgi:hypothetical protein